MYRKNIAAAAAILFLASSISIPSMAAPAIEKDLGGREQAEEMETSIPEAGFQPETETQIEAGFIEETELEIETETEEETEEEIKSPVIEKNFRFFQVDKKYGLVKKDEVYIYEKMDTDSDKVGRIDKFDVLHILSEEDDGWYYVESGRVRGFIKDNHIMTGSKAEKYIEMKSEENLDTAEELKEAYENEAFLYKQTTAYETLARKKYALAKDALKIFDRIPEEDHRTEDTDAEGLEDESEKINISESESEEDEIEETETEIEEDTKEDEKSTEKEKEGKPGIVGTLEKEGLCYILADEDEDWIYVESGDVRGFVKAEELDKDYEIRSEIRKNGEDSYKLAKEKIKPEDNRACYYTYTSVKEASVSGLIRSSMIAYAEQFLGNPYVWGGTSLTKGADCSGFIQSIYAKFGYGIPRIAEDQAYCGTKIPVEDALPGDLIFYSRNNYIYHVVMCSGEGQTIEAQSSETGIVRSNVNYGNAVWAVRIISDEDTDILEYLKKNNMASEYYNEAVIAKAVDYGNFLGNFKLTAYCSCPVCCGIWSGGPTASGVMPTENHTVAMAGVPFGTELIINGQIYTVEDRGTPYGHVDIYMEDHNEALQFGLQYSEVFQKQ